MARRVLIADDEPGILTSVAEVLQANGAYEVLLAKDGEEALALAQKERPDLVLLDIVMPKKLGHEVCQALKSDPSTRQIKVVMLSVLDHRYHRMTAYQVGADGYLVKPFSPEELLKKVRELVGPPAR